MSALETANRGRQGHAGRKHGSVVGGQHRLSNSIVDVISAGVPPPRLRITSSASFVTFAVASGTQTLVYVTLHLGGTQLNGRRSIINSLG